MANPSPYELARTYGIAAVAAMRGGELTDRQKRKLQQLAERAAKRENSK
ncbi:hypothetical protein [Streptomyces venezuelae]